MQNVSVQISERVDLITVRHIQQSLRVKLSMFMRAYHFVCHIVVDIVGTHGARISEIHKLYRCRAQGAYAIAIACCVPIQIDQDVNTISSDCFSTFLVAVFVIKMLEMLHLNREFLSVI